VDIQLIPASKKRIILAIYLDFILFMVFWSFLNHLLFSDRVLSFWLALGIFSLLEFVSIKIFGSIGMVFLSIDESHQVDPDINKRENWLTILLGVLFILEGTKQLVRWIDQPVHWPIFGMVPDQNIQIILSILGGLLFLVAGYLFLKLKPAGILLGLVLVIGIIVSSIISWSLWDETVAKMVIARRELQGLPVRDGEIEFMQTLMPEGIVAAAVIIGLGILFSYKRCN
jgi:hypothetical protein